MVLLKCLGKHENSWPCQITIFFGHNGQHTNAALAEIDKIIVHLEMGIILNKQELELLFAPTGQIQEVSIDSGWGEEFLILAERFDDEISKL